MSEKRLYKTADITLAASLVFKGMKVLGVEEIPEKKRHEIYRFILEDTDERTSYVLEYTSNGLFVEPKAFMNNIRTLKQMIKDQKNPEEQ